ncbi:MAG TPA: hypothetical protein VF017_06455 [Thermoanaerobaculia bacterium]|nr:hypothetical protein [Thermoanaerobaculia bacterium]
MTKVSAQQASADLLDLLDAVEQGEEVVVEREGREFRLSLVPPAAEKPEALLIIEDPDVLSGEWTWAAGHDGQLEFQPRR